MLRARAQEPKKCLSAERDQNLLARAPTNLPRAVIPANWRAKSLQSKQRSVLALALERWRGSQWMPSQVLKETRDGLESLVKPHSRGVGKDPRREQDH